MNTRSASLTLLLACLLSLAYGQDDRYAIIPAPVSLTPAKGWADLRGATVVAPAELADAADLLRGFLPSAGTASGKATCRITLATDPSLHDDPEFHRLEIKPGQIHLTGAGTTGVLRGIQSIAQLIDREGRVPACRIEDLPRFPYRGMHLDVCRHFFPVSFIKTYIDLLARYKFSTFHWHLTEDQGWRIEIKRYPRLTEVGAWRKGSQVGPYAAMTFDSIPYGGFYTQEEVREVVRYAAARGITVMPEIELPGHSLAALSAYPELSCTGGPFEVARGWGVFEDVFCPKEETFTFLEGVLDEVMELFPSEYIHIGGDECPKERWKHCNHCQELIRREGLKDEHELQSWFIRRIERHINSRGRKLIGWDEIMEGGLAPNAAVMSWRGTEGGISAARSGHFAVMTPGSHCYFDHYQGDPAFEPLAIGGYTTLQKVYAYEPVPRELDVEESRFILGAQGNVWTEYMSDSAHVTYMALPRMLALAEVLWTPAAQRNEPDFLRRLEREFRWLDSRNIRYARSLYQVRLAPGPSETPGNLKVKAMASIPGDRMTLTVEDASGARRFTDRSEVEISSDATVSGAVARQDGQAYPASKRTFSFNRATGRTISLSNPPDERYAHGGAFTLVDGIRAGDRLVGSEWLGWTSDVSLTLDLGRLERLESVTLGTRHEPHSWIHRPEEVAVWASIDGSDFQLVSRIPVPEGLDASARGGRIPYSVSIGKEARYLRLEVRHRGIIPPGFNGAGHPAWLFLDEIEVR